MLTADGSMMIGLRALIALSVAMGIITVTLWLERKIAARVQSRIGPYEVGRPHGWLQPIADALKMLQKEDMTPAAADGILFRIAPVWVATTALAGVTFLQWWP